MKEKESSEMIENKWIKIFYLEKIEIIQILLLNF